MKDKIAERFEELATEGDQLKAMLQTSDAGNYWYRIDLNATAKYRAWISSAINLFKVATKTESHYSQEAARLMAHQDVSVGDIPTAIFLNILGLFSSAKAEWDKDLLKELQYVVLAETFDDFLDHSADYHRAGKVQEASVLASAVLEDTIKKIAAKNNVGPSGSLEPLVDELAKAGVFTPVKAKRVKAYAGTRNAALHAEWSKIDIKDVGEMINGIRELIENYL